MDRIGRGRPSPHKEEIRRLLGEGYGIRQIARMVGLSHTAIRYHQRQLQGTAPSEKLPTNKARKGDRRLREFRQDAKPTSVEVSHERGRGLLWTIALDPAAPPAARVNAIDKLREIESWDFLVGKHERTLPAPLTRPQLVERLACLLGSVEEDVLREALGQLRYKLVAEGPPPRPGLVVFDKPTADP